MIPAKLSLTTIQPHENSRWFVVPGKLGALKEKEHQRQRQKRHPSHNNVGKKVRIPVECYSDIQATRGPIKFRGPVTIRIVGCKNTGVNVGPCGHDF